MEHIILRSRLTCFGNLPGTHRTSGSLDSKFLWAKLISQCPSISGVKFYRAMCATMSRTPRPRSQAKPKTPLCVCQISLACASRNAPKKPVYASSLEPLQLAHLGLLRPRTHWQRTQPASVSASDVRYFATVFDRRLCCQRNLLSGSLVFDWG